MPPETTIIPLSDANDLDAVIHALGIEDSDTTPAEAVAELKAEIERLRGELASALLALCRNEAWSHDALAALELVECVYRKNAVAEGEPSSVLDAMQAAIAKGTGTKNVEA